MKKKILIFIIIGIVIYFTIAAIEFCCIYAVQGDNIWNYINDFWNWYKKLF